MQYARGILYQSKGKHHQYVAVVLVTILQENGLYYTPALRDIKGTEGTRAFLQPETLQGHFGVPYPSWTRFQRFMKDLTRGSRRF